MLSDAFTREVVKPADAYLQAQILGGLDRIAQVQELEAWATQTSSESTNTHMPKLNRKIVILLSHE